jgi:hypothetical protein
MSKSQKLNASQILAIVQSRSEWSARATSVANPERVASIDATGGMFDASGTKLRAYVNAAGIATLETNAEYKIRKGIRAEAKTARKSAPTVQTPTAQPAPADARDASILQALDLLKSAGIDVATLAGQMQAVQDARPVAQPAPAPAVKKSKVAKNPANVATPATAPAEPAYTSSPTKNVAIRAIDNKLARMGKTRAQLEAKNGWVLTELPVRKLRDISNGMDAKVDAYLAKQS